MKKITIVLSDAEAESLATFRKAEGYKTDEDAVRAAVERAGASLVRKVVLAPPTKAVPARDTQRPNAAIETPGSYPQIEPGMIWAAPSGDPGPSHRFPSPGSPGMDLR